MLDCCEAGGSLHSSILAAPTTNVSANVSSSPGTTELIAASPFDTLAPGPGKLSFTTALITELRVLAEKGQFFSVVELHKRVLTNIIKQRTGPECKITRGWLFPSVSPVYVRLVGGAEIPSIGLMRLGGKVEEADLMSTATGSSMSFFNLTNDLPEDFVRAYRARKDAQAAGDAADRSEGKYWRLWEYEDKHALKIEKRKQRLKAFDWKQRKGSFLRNVARLRDLILRVPKLEGCDL